MNIEDLHLSLAHIGINPVSDQSVEEVCALFSALTGQGIRDNNSSFFVGNSLEIMKGPWKGAHGHLAFWTDDIAASIQLFEARGLSVDLSSAQYFENGSMKVVYLQRDYGGFAVHLMQRA
jgi:2-dehydro-3-deoxyphosphogluconate aldolase/(4S)-4-hydroxy-2-oxoglutarate aldolase